MNHLKHLCTITVILLIVLLFSAPEAQAQAGEWKIVHSPNASRVYDILTSVATVSANDAWAVGYSQKSNTDPELTLIEHWNGSGWKIVPSPNPSFTHNDLYKINAVLNGVATLSANDAWAVGYYTHNQTNGSVSIETLIEHWDGTQWSIFPSPSPNLYSEFYSVAAVSADDIWAVGETVNFDKQIISNLIEHWNGSQWSVIGSTNSIQGGSLHSVSASSSTDVWLGGGSVYGGSSGPPFMHWDGSTWTVVSSPGPGIEREIDAITAVSANNAWAVGDYTHDDGGEDVSATLVEHWDGSQWSIVNSPNPANNDSLAGVSTVSANDIWAVGYTKPYNYEPLIEHWDGNTWSVFPSPSPPFGEEFSLNSVSALPTGNALTVGDYYTVTGHKQIERTLTFTEVYRKK